MDLPLLAFLDVVRRSSYGLAREVIILCNLASLMNMLEETTIDQVIKKSLLFFYMMGSIAVWIVVDQSVSENPNDTYNYQFYLLYIYGFLTARIVVITDLSNL